MEKRINNADIGFDDITIESEAMEQEVRNKLELGHLIPAFQLQDSKGNMVSPSDFKDKKNLVIYFFDLHNSEDWEILAEIKQHYNDFESANAEVLAISGGPMEEIKECMQSLQLPFSVLCDCKEEAKCSYCVLESTIFVADKFGELKLQEIVKEDNLDKILNSVQSQLELIELECPECGVSSWPEF